MVLLCSVAGVMSAGYGAIFALLGDFRDTYGISESRLGMVIGMGFISGFLAQIAVAPLADRGYAKRVVLVGASAYVVGTLIVGFADSFWPMMIGRFVMGLGVGSAAPAIRRIVIVADPERLGQRLGILMSAEIGGFAMGPAVAGALAGPFGLSAPFVVLAAVNALLAALVIGVRLAEGRHDGGPRFAFDLLRYRAFTSALFTAAGVYVMIGVFDALWSLAMTDLEASDWLTTLGITMFALPMVVLGPLGGRLAQRIGPYRWGTFGAALGAAALCSYGLVGSGMAMFVVAMLHSSADAFTFPSSSVATGLVVAPGRQAAAQGVIGGFQTLMAGVASVMAGALYERFGRTTAYLSGAMVMGVMVLIGAILAIPTWRLRHPAWKSM